VLRAACANAGIEPHDVDYVEAHGTGTLLGDPIEARALGTALGRARPQGAPLLIGAVKSNLGHLEAAAGIAGFIKAVLAVQRGHIPANLHFTTPNPHIPFDELRLKVIDKPTDWPSKGESGQPRRAGVSAFGFGGTNAHVVLEQGPELPPVAVDQPGNGAVTTLVVSAKTADRIASTAGTLAEWMDGAGAHVTVAELAHALNHHRSRYAKFATVAALDRAQAVAGLRALAAGESADGVVAPHEGRCRPGTVFVYSGQGSQWAGMGRQLLADEPAFAAAVAELEPIFVEQVGFSLQQVLANGEALVGIDRIQPVLVGMQLALTELWRSYGVEPDAVIGHSMGEVAASVVAGALTPAEGLRVIATRSRLMARLSGQGAMALLELDPHSAEALIADHPGVTLAVYASPRQSVIAGPPEQVDAVVAVVAGQDLLARRIEVDVASHHPIIDPVLPDLRTALADLAPRWPTIPVISTTEDYAASAAINFDANYWSANLRNPVRFSQAIAAAGADHGTFIEVSPHPVLTYAIDDTLADVHHHSVPTLQRDAHDALIFHTNLNATLTVTPPSTEHPSGPPVVIPATPWHHTRHWMPTKDRVDGAGSAPKHGTLLGAHISVATTPPASLWQARVLPDAKPYPGFHRIHGMEVVPASVLIQTISAAASESGASSVSAVRFEHPIVLDQPRVIQVVADGESVTVSSRPASDKTPWRWVRHVTGRLSPPPSFGAADADVYVATDRQQNLNGEETRSVAELLAAWGVEGQPFPWSVDALRRTAGGATAEVRLAEKSPVALLDAAVHVARLVDRANPRLMVPAGADSVRVAAGLTDLRGLVEIRRLDGNSNEIVVDIVAKTPDGTTCVDIRSLRYVDVESSGGQTPDGDTDPRSLAHAIEWQPWRQDDEADTPAPAQGPATLAVIGGAGGARDELQVRLADAGYSRAGPGDARYVLYLAEPAPGEADLDAAVRLSTEVSELVQLLADRDNQHPATLWIITRGVREARSEEALAQSCLWGLARVIAAEEPEVYGGLVDIAAEDDLSAVVSALFTALPTAAEPILALRDGQLLAPALVPVTGQPVREPLRCNLSAAYLITGGLGVLGLLMADWLVDRGARRLVLAGRTAMPPRRDWDTDTDPDTRDKITAIRALESRGVAVDVVALDVGSAEAVEALLTRRDRDGAPPIRGVIHAAGVTESKFVTETADTTFRRVMWPKIAGGHALRTAFPPTALDFFFLVGTAGTFFGIPGQGAYAAANAYLDGLARARHPQGCHTVSLGWVAWRGLGFGSDAAIVEHELERLGSRPVTPKEAFAAWEYVDAYDIAQAVMAPMASSSRTDFEADRTSRSAQAWSAMEADELRGEVETGLRKILARELRVAETELDVDLPFAELGLNSLMAMSIRREAEQLAGIKLSATMLWNHPTIETLTTFLVEKLSPQQDSDGNIDVLSESTGSVLDTLLDEVESAPAGVESGSL
jgi:phthiocerol/phenolphthiocerol synthesis type-I polyketide synthase A